MTWVNTPPKFEEEKVEDGEEGEGGEGEGGEGDDSEEEPPSEDEKDAAELEDGEEEKEPELDENGEPIVIKEPQYYKESDFHLRVPHKDFQHLKTLETTAMSSVET